MQKIRYTGIDDNGSQVPVDVSFTDDGEALVSIAGGSLEAPHTLAIDHTVTTAAAATLDFGTTVDISAYHNGQVYISVTTDTIAITGTRGSQTGIPVHVIAADGTRSAATGLATGTYEFARLDFDTLTFTKTGTNAVGTVDARFTP